MRGTPCRVIPPNPVPPAETIGRWVKRSSSWEVLVFLFLIVPSMVLSFFVVRQGTLGFVFTAFVVMLRDLAMVSLILFFLWRNGEPWESLGWNYKNGWKDVVLGIGLVSAHVLCSRLA